MKYDENLVSIMYDYIIDTSITQKKLLPFLDLYGDGTRWNKQKALFEHVYNIIKETIIKNKVTF
jgi:hypothetical protein